MNTLAFDPGQNPGWALFSQAAAMGAPRLMPDKRLLIAWSPRLQDVLRHVSVPFELVAEYQYMPKPRAGKKPTIDPRSIIRLALRAGIGLGVASGHPLCKAAYAVPVHTWKNALWRAGSSLEKAQFCERVRRCLLAEEREILAQYPRGAQMDLLDAYGIGQAWCRIEKKDSYRLTAKDGIICN